MLWVHSSAACSALHPFFIVSVVPRRDLASVNVRPRRVGTVVFHSYRYCILVLVGIFIRSSFEMHAATECTCTFRHLMLFSVFFSYRIIFSPSFLHAFTSLPRARTHPNLSDSTQLVLRKAKAPRAARIARAVVAVVVVLIPFIERKARGFHFFST